MLRVSELTDKAQTGKEMYRLAHDYSEDINQFNTADGRRLSDISLGEYYDIVRNIPFRQDSPGVEVVTRPFHLFSTPLRGWDCKKKAIAIGAWLDQNQIPFRFKAVSRRPDQEIHHVIVEARDGESWIPIDATYADNELGEEENWTAEEFLPFDGPGTMGSSAKLVSMYGDGDYSPELVQEFMAGMSRISPAQMGSLTAGAIVAIVSGIFTAVGGITAAIISAVSNKRQQERQIAHSVEMQQLQNQAFIEQAQAQEVSSVGGIPEWLLPAAAIGGALLLL